MAEPWRTNAPLENPNSPYAKERVKFEMDHSPFGAPGRDRRTIGFKEYPMMLFLAGPPEGGLGAITLIDYCIVGSDRERNEKEQLGFRTTPAEAIKAYEATDLEHAKLNANLEHQKAHTLSPKA